MFLVKKKFTKTERPGYLYEDANGISELLSGRKMRRIQDNYVVFLSYATSDVQQFWKDTSIPYRSLRTGE